MPTKTRTRRSARIKPVDERFLNLLTDYFDQPGCLSKADFAAAAGCSRNYVYELLEGKHGAGGTLMDKMSEIMGYRIVFEKLKSTCHV